ncbi:SpoIIE family protein phosphatase [uncultured Marivirga sp.]|uniref:SpoIIE family protein phosphatase n=1 Tax=uncultured Marivirga sp. TaxID=1123707 RepID=UPI0030EF5F72
MKFKVYHIALFFIAFCLHLQTNAQLERIEKFEIDDFLGEKAFKSATQSDGLLIYFNTSAGILSYDGHEFRSVRALNNEVDINQIYYFNNSLFISSKKSLSQYFPKNDSVSTISDINVNQFDEIGNQLWMITDRELYVWENNKLKKIYQAENSEQFTCLEVKNSTTLIGHSEGLTVLNKGKKVKTFASYLKPSKFIDGDSSIHILSGNAILELVGDRVVRSLANNTEILDFYIDDFGKTWFIDEQSILKVNDLIKSKPQFVAKNKPVKGNSIFNDKEGNLWILGNSQLVKLTQKNPFSKIPEDNARKVFVGSNGNLILKTDEIIMYNFITENQTVKIPKSSTPLSEYYAFDDEDSWIITINETIYSLSKKEGKLTSILNQSQYAPLKKVKEGQYIAKNRAGTLFLVNDEFIPTKKLAGSNSSHKITFSNQKIYTYSSQNSITVLDSIGEIELRTDFADSIKLANVVPAKDGYWYFGTNKIFWMNADGQANLVDIDQSEDLENIYIMNVFDDMENNLWVSSKNTLFRFPIAEKSNKTILQKPEKYDKNDFIFSSYFKDAVRDNTGRIWFLNENGISLYNPLKEIPNLVPPSVEITKSIAYQLDDFNNPTDTVFLTDNNQKISNNSIVVIEPKVINHFDNSNSSISYKNLSINQSERIIGSDEKIILTDLSDGLNAIAIKGYNSSGVESINEEKINIYVTPPIWKRNWFYASTALSLLFLGFIGYRTVISIKNSRARELEDELHKGLEDLEKKSHLQVLKAERLKQLNDLITSQKSELEKKNKQIESQKYELSLTNQQIKKQKDLLEETSSKLTSSINYAKRIQNALMSTEVEIKKAIDESFVYFLPRDVVSGDFFWFNKAENEKGEELWILAAVDCTGHGVPGAIVSVVGMNLLNNITKLKKVYDPGQILTEMNQDIISDLRQDETQVNDGMDMTIVTYNTVSKQLYFAGAKNPLMYVEDGELIRIKGDKHAIGGQQRGDDRIFSTHTLDLTDGKKRTFYLFSDGFQDQFGGEKGFKYLVGNFKKLLLSIHQKNVLEQKTILHEEIEDWKDGYAQTDDILVIGFKI